MPMPENDNLKPHLERRRWAIGGQVQGVGFRPFVYRLATQLQLTGWVANNSTGVVIETQGLPTDLARFAQNLRGEIPPLARIDHLTQNLVAIDPQETDFQILASDEHGQTTVAVTPDTALCHHCRQDLFDSGNRRFRHALITCTNCGPRYSLMVHVPYDRPATTMAGFTMCPACGHEYQNSSDRRFHAQPIACPDCGPQLELVNPVGEYLGGDPITKAAELLRNGKIVAIKGLGGFHLAVRADDAQGVERLRRLKHRDAKPFALMCGSVEAAGQYVTLSSAAAKALASPAAPIILARRRGGTAVAPLVAPG
ncbi:MAG: carbamoyltransferase HypF, partial [Phycisphaerae bacterium]|nr:carbamoyltransferase HypF [Phycisphaerae bacterium]